MATRVQALTVLAGAGALVFVAAAAYLTGAKRSEVPTTRLTLATCGLVPSPEPIDLPLAALLQKAGAPGLTLGPILHPGLDAPLSLHVRAQAHPETPQPEQTAEALVLSVDPARLPDEIRLSCRYGAVARVEYRRGPLRHALDVRQPAPEAPVPAVLPAVDAAPEAEPEAADIQSDSYPRDPDLAASRG